MFKYGLPVLQALLIVLKIAGALACGWGMILIPLYIYMGCGILYLAMAIVAEALKK